MDGAHLLNKGKPRGQGWSDHFVNAFFKIIIIIIILAIIEEDDEEEEKILISSRTYIDFSAESGWSFWGHRLHVNSSQLYATLKIERWYKHLNPRGLNETGAKKIQWN